MSWPKTGKYGIVDNPIVFSPYNQNDDEESEFPPSSDIFLLLNGNFFGLLGQGLLLLL